MKRSRLPIQRLLSNYFYVQSGFAHISKTRALEKVQVEFLTFWKEFLIDTVWNSAKFFKQEFISDSKFLRICGRKSALICARPVLQNPDARYRSKYCTMTGFKWMSATYQESHRDGQCLASAHNISHQEEVKTWSHRGIL